MDSYDNEIVTFRIQQLLQQFNIVEDTGLIIVFGPIDSMSSYSHWICSRMDGIYYRECGLFDLMQNLLDVFIEYRNSFNLSPYNHGVIKIKSKNILIKWVNESEADNEVSRLKRLKNKSTK